MAINKIDRVVLHEDVKQDLNNRATKQELQNAKEELINSMNEVYQGISWKPPVPTFNDLRIEYPDAKDGWKSTTMDTNITYQYDLETDTWFATSINALPLATSDIDGLMASNDKSKLDTIQLNAQKNLTPQQALEQIKTVDGKDSGLDADLFQGRLPDSFADKEHDHDGLYYRKSEVISFLNDKAPKGHVHSKEQITDFEHNHSPSEIVENETKRFVSDIEKANWNDADSKKHTHGNKSIIDTITQILIDKWNSAWEHISDTVKHITSAERAKWNTVDDKVDKITGQGLSDENYTLVEKNKLAKIEDEANKYIHPSAHPASMITESTTKRFVSDTDKANWDAKETPEGAQEKADLAESNSKAYTDDHKSDTVKHITATERTNWNNKAKISDIPTKVGQLENDKNYVTAEELGNAGYGDMMKSVYDKDGDGIVDEADISSSFRMLDTRSINDTPDELMARRTFGMFKYRSSVGNPPVRTNNNYVFILNIIGWSVLEGSGGWPIQLAFGVDGIAYRKGISSIEWSGWTQFAEKDDIPTKLSEFTNDIDFDDRYYTESEIDSKLNTKVDKASGKQLSTEDFTTTEKTKLANIEYGANNYTHPATHPVDMIVGLHSIAKSGNYSELNGKPTKLSQFEYDTKPYHKGTTPPTNTNLLWLDTNA